MKINTSNPNKQKEFLRFFPSAIFTCVDLMEIKSQDNSLVSAHKAFSIGLDTLIDDTALAVEGFDIGTEIKWMLKSLDQYIGAKATFICTLAIQRKTGIFVYTGKINGKIVQPSCANSFGFDAFFQPLGESKTLAEQKLDKFNARFLACQNFIQGKPSIIYPLDYFQDKVFEYQ